METDILGTPYENRRITLDPDEEGEVVARCSGELVCPAQRIQGLFHFASRRAMDIEGLGERLIQALVDSDQVKSIADLERIPVMTSEADLSAMASIASSRRRTRSERQSFASSTAERVRWPWCFSSLASKRSNSVNASAVAPAKPASTRSW